MDFTRWRSAFIRNAIFVTRTSIESGWRVSRQTVAEASRLAPSTIPQKMTRGSMGQIYDCSTSSIINQTHVQLLARSVLLRWAFPKPITSPTFRHRSATHLLTAKFFPDPDLWLGPPA